MLKLSKKTCKTELCMKSPCFNFEGEKIGLYCTTHKLQNMIDITHRKLCNEPGCKTRPSYNTEGEKEAKYCVKHKQPDMIDVLLISCKEYGCKISSRFNYEGEKEEFIVMLIRKQIWLM